MFKLLKAAVVALTLAVLHSPGFASQGSGCMPTTGTVSGLTLVQDINAGLAAVISSNSGATTPATDCSGVPVLGQLWVDTTSATTPILKIYTGSAWVRIGTVDVSNGLWLPPAGGGSGSIASGSTTNLCTPPESFVTISGTTTITSFGSSCIIGQFKDVRFSGALTLTYNATSMILPTSASITTAAGDTARAVYLGSGNWTVVAYQRRDGSSLASSSVFTGAVFFNGVITPTTLSGTTNDWNPTGLSTANTIRAQSSTTVNLTGIVAPATDGKRLLIRNVGSNTITLKTETGSTAANRFKLAADFALAAGNAIEVVYDLTAARWYAATTAVPAVVTPTIINPIVGYRNLVVANVATRQGGSAPATPNKQMKITADQMTLTDASGNAVQLSAVSCTVDLTVSGAGGLDTGSQASSTWYSIWVIYNSGSATTSCLLSIQTSASLLTLPSGYTYRGRVGWNLTSGSTIFYRVQQQNTKATYVVGANPSISRVVVSGQNGSNIFGGGSTQENITFSTVSLSSFVPPTASSAFLGASGRNSGSGGSGATIVIAPNTNLGGTGYGPNGSAGMVYTYSISGIDTTAVGVWVPLESSNIGYASSSSGALVVCHGWEDNL